MIILDTTSATVRVVTGSAVNTDVVAAWVDHTTSGGTPASAGAQITTATTTAVVAAPAASTQRQVKSLSVTNVGTAAQTVTVQRFDGTNALALITVSLSAGDSLQYEDGRGFFVLASSGATKGSSELASGVGGQPVFFYKVGTAPEAAGQFYGWWKDSGAPGAWAPGTPGVNGRVTDGTAAADAGCLLIKNPTSGANYLTQFNPAASVACNVLLLDVLWVNTGLVVTTTTAQAITSPTLPARDNNGSTNGEGVFAAIIVTTATTNAGAITNMTLNYTNSDGVASRTATVASFPATAVIGTVVHFQLQAGDKGIRSIQGVTFGTSLGGGAVSLIMYRPLAGAPVLLANVGGQPSPPASSGVRLYNGTCALPFGLMSATTATTLTGSAVVIER